MQKVKITIGDYFGLYLTQIDIQCNMHGFLVEGHISHGTYKYQSMQNLCDCTTAL